MSSTGMKFVKTALFWEYLKSLIDSIACLES
jgi:hypothetical protein